MQSKIIETFKELALVYEDKKGGPKLDILSEKLDKLNIPYEWTPGIGLIVNKQENPKKVIVSHMDLIRKFRIGFGNSEICSVKKETIVGALDNTITNAVLLLVIEDLQKSNKLEGVEFLFSEGEEVGFIGMNGYFKEHKKRSGKAFFINLDVTNEGYKQSASVEYDACNFDCLKAIQKIESDLDYDFFYTGNRVCDDMDSVITNGSHGLSYCLPTKENIHSYKNKARLSSLVPYYEGLLSLIIDLKEEVSLDISKNVNSWSFNSALEAAEFKDISTQSSNSWNSPSSYVNDFFDTEDKLTKKETVLENLEFILFSDTIFYQDILNDSICDKKVFFDLVEYSVKLDFFNPRYFEFILGEINSKEMFEVLVDKKVLIHIKSRDIYMLQSFEENDNLDILIDISNLTFLKDSKNLSPVAIVNFLRTLNLLFVYKTKMTLQYMAHSKFDKSWINEAIEEKLLFLKDNKLVIKE